MSTTRPDTRSPGQPLKRRIALEAVRDADHLRKSLGLLIAHVAASHTPLPDILAQHGVTVAQWDQSQRDMRDRAITEARAALAAPTWMGRFLDAPS